MRIWILSILLLLIAPSVLAAPKLDPVSVAISRLDQNKPDPVEFSYVGIRCGALNSMLGLAFEYQGNGTQDEKRMEALFKADGDAFKNVGFYMGISAKQSNEFMLKQFDYFLHLYGDEWAQGKKLNNNSWTPYIDSEVKSCEVVKPLFVNLSKVIDKNNPRK
jgi:hypothetical protein